MERGKSVDDQPDRAVQGCPVRKAGNTTTINVVLFSANKLVKTPSQGPSLKQSPYNVLDSLSNQTFFSVAVQALVYC